MRIYNKYIIYLALTSCLINALLAFFGQDNIEIYFAINILVYLIITLLYVYLNPRAKKALSSIGIVLFAGFMVIVSIKVIEILSGR